MNVFRIDNILLFQEGWKEIFALKVVKYQNKNSIENSIVIIFYRLQFMTYLDDTALGVPGSDGDFRSDSLRLGTPQLPRSHS